MSFAIYKNLILSCCRILYLQLMREYFSHIYSFNKHLLTTFCSRQQEDRTEGTWGKERGLVPVLSSSQWPPAHQCSQRETLSSRRIPHLSEHPAETLLSDRECFLFWGLLTVPKWPLSPYSTFNILLVLTDLFLPFSMVVTSFFLCSFRNNTIYVSSCLERGLSYFSYFANSASW